MVFNTLGEDADMEVGEDWFHDYACTSACGWCKKGFQNQAWGRSCGGFSPKIHALVMCSAPLPFNGRRTSYYRQALALLDGMDALRLSWPTRAMTRIMSWKPQNSWGPRAWWPQNPTVKTLDILIKSFTGSAILLREHSINSRISVMLPPVTIKKPQLILLLSWSQAFAYGLNNMSIRPRL